MAADPEYEKGLQKAYRLLAARARSEKELRAKLKEKKMEDGIVDRIVARLYERGYLDDGAFAQQWARRMAMDRLSSDRHIELSLQQKGVGRDLCERVLAEIRRERPEAETIRRLMKRRLKGAGLQEQDYQMKRRLAQYLMSKGFAPGLIYEMIKEAQEGYQDDDGQPD
jgi:regulatory protein